MTFPNTQALSQLKAKEKDKMREKLPRFPLPLRAGFSHLPKAPGHPAHSSMVSNPLRSRNPTLPIPASLPHCEQQTLVSRPDLIVRIHTVTVYPATVYPVTVYPESSEISILPALESLQTRYITFRLTQSPSAYLQNLTK